MFTIDPDTMAQHRVRGRGRRAFWGLLLIGGAVLLLSYLTGCAGHSGHRGDHSPAAMLEKIDRGADWVLHKGDATQEQRARVHVVLDDLKPDLLKYHNEHRKLVGQFVHAIEAEPISQADLDQVRTAGLNLAEQAFNRSFDAMVKAAAVLTPEQRKELIASWKAHQ